MKFKTFLMFGNEFQLPFAVFVFTLKAVQRFCVIRSLFAVNTWFRSLSRKISFAVKEIGL